MMKDIAPSQVQKTNKVHKKKLFWVGSIMICTSTSFFLWSDDDFSVFELGLLIIVGSVGLILFVASFWPETQDVNVIHSQVKESDFQKLKKD